MAHSTMPIEIGKSGGGGLGGPQAPSNVRRYVHPPLTVSPRAASREALEHLLARLQQLRADIPQLPIDYTKYKGLQLRSRALFHIVDYLRSLRFAAEILTAVPARSSLEDHDRIASYVLYLFAQFELLRNADGLDRSLRAWLAKELRSESHEAVNAFEAKFPREVRDDSCDVGILTVLEAEYQSVLRRLDHFERFTEEACRGFAILDRLSPKDDLKRKPAEDIPVGWALGRVGAVRVLVICSGAPGKEGTLRTLDDGIMEIFQQPRLGWVVTGICAGTNERWPIGTVLVAEAGLHEVTRTHSQQFTIDPAVHPQPTVPGSITSPLRMDHLFRRPPKENPESIAVASPLKVPVVGVRFACTGQVINQRTDREALRVQLQQSLGIELPEHLGIEMEGAGVAAYGGAPVGIIKGVCDYADERKLSWKRTGTETLFQLYAAETAAEYLVQRLRALNVLNGSDDQCFPAESH